ncbi:MAG: MBL fold metallo-hydrolase [Actinobacteria bacterium]|nr:MBL fold metallo-hydrolase [Actinomycetota bacterium]
MEVPPNTDRFYFRQLLSGRDFATSDPIAQQMVNFVYVIGDRSTSECVLIDPAYSVNELLDIVEGEGMRVTGILATHFHADHIGGNLMGHHLEGVATLLDRIDCPVHVQRDETPWVTRTSGLTVDQLVQHSGGDKVRVGDIDITLVHTPGHTPGSQCFHVDGRLVSGDTLFLDGCGRTDFPGSDPAAMYDSLQTLAAMPDGTIVFPGHHYSPPASATIDSIRHNNYVYQPHTKEQWLAMFAGS